MSSLTMCKVQRSVHDTDTQNLNFTTTHQVLDQPKATCSALLVTHCELGCKHWPPSLQAMAPRRAGKNAGKSERESSEQKTVKLYVKY